MEWFTPRRAVRARMRGPTLLAVVLLLASGCAAPGSETSGAPNASQASATPASQGASPTPAPAHAESAPGAPLVVALDLDGVERVATDGMRARVTITGMGTDALRAGLALPDGVALVAGNLSYAGPLVEGGAVRLDATLRVPAEGVYLLRAWAEAPLPVGSRAAPSALLTVQRDAAGARVLRPAPPTPTLQVTLEPGADAAHARLVVGANATLGARLVVSLPDPFPQPRLREENVTLERGVGLARELDLGTPEAWSGGYVAVSAYLYPDPAVDGRLYADALYYWWQDGALRVAESPPQEGASPGNATPMPAT